MKQEQIKFRDDFEFPSYDEWKEAAIKALKGAPFDKKMFTKTYEDITLEPIYTKENIEHLEHIKNQYPGFYPYVRSAKTIGAKADPWHISQEIPYPSPELLNEALLNDLSKGQSAINIKAEESLFLSNEYSYEKITRKHTLINSIADFEEIFKDIAIRHYPVYLSAGQATPQLAVLFAAFCNKHNIDLNAIKGGFNFDFIGSALETGKLYSKPEKYIKELKLFFDWATNQFPNFSLITINGDVYHNGGASSIQELAYVLSTGVYYIKSLIDEGLSIEEIAPKIKISISVGSNFFMEIAKIRALRVLWAKIIKEFGGSEELAKAFIHTNTSVREKTKYDPYVNMLRNTSQAFSAVVGGCDSLHVSYLDQEYTLPDKFSRRMSRNTQIILNEEAHVNDNIDPAGGSWFVETLTSQIIEKTWELFTETEKDGGIIKSLENNIPQSKIDEKYKERVKNISTRKETILGTNKYPNLQEKPIQIKVKFDENDFENYISNYKKSTSIKNEIIFNKDYFENAAKFAEKGALAYDLFNSFIENENELKITQIPLRRTAKVFEELRNNIIKIKQNTGENPKVDLVCFGLLKQYKPRADFSADFFQVGGFEFNIHDGFENGTDAAEKIKDKDAKVMIICSTDEIYEKVVNDFAQLMKQYKPDSMLVLAGYPKDKIEEYKSSGIDEFIHIKANIYQILSDLHSRLGLD